MGIYPWCPGRDSNSQNSDFESDTYTNSITWACKNTNKPVSLGRVAEHRSIIDRLITGNNYGALTHTPDPLDVHHCTVPAGGYPYTFFVCKMVPKERLELSKFGF